MDILFTNATILPMTAAGDEPRTFTGAVGVAGNRIALVTASGSEADAFRTCSPGVRVIDCTGRLLMPGLVNTHCHAAMTLQRSYADDIALMEWLNDYIWPFEARQLPLVAHNSPFDEGCLRAVFELYGMPYPGYRFYCTCRASRRTFGSRLPNHQLHTVSAACGFDLANHHHALADAEACARIALKIL